MSIMAPVLAPVVPRGVEVGAVDPVDSGSTLGAGQDGAVQDQVLGRHAAQGVGLSDPGRDSRPAPRPKNTRV